MKYLIPLLVLCAAFFVVSDAAPVPPFGFKLKAASAQWDDWGSTFLNRMFNFIPAAARDGTAAAAARDGIKTLLGKTILKSLRELLSNSKPSDPTDNETWQSISDGIISILSLIEKSLDEGQPAADKDKIDQIIFDTMDNFISAEERNTDPNDEVTRTMINGFKTFFTVFRNYMENGGIIQSSEGHVEMKQAIMNFLGKIQSVPHGTEDEMIRTTTTVMKGIVGTACKNINPNNEVAKAICDCSDAIFSLPGKIFGNRENRPTDEEVINEFISHFSNIVSAVVKRIANGKVQSTDHTGEAKTQLWGPILSSLATSVLKEYLDG